MEKYYKIAEGKVIETVTVIPEIMWERKGLLPYEKIIKTEAPVEIVGEKIDLTEKVAIDVQDKKVVETITKYKIAPTVEEIKIIQIKGIENIYEMKIFEKYSVLEQSLAALGILTTDKIKKMKDFIQIQIDKRILLINTVNACKTINEVNLVEWN